MQRGGDKASLERREEGGGLVTVEEGGHLFTEKERIMNRRSATCIARSKKYIDQERQTQIYANCVLYTLGVM